MNVMALCLFLLVPGVHFWVDALSMVLFGTAIGVLLCFLGGLMAVDIAPRNASGAALGIVGIASYIGAGIQDIMSGILIGGHKSIVDGKEIYDFFLYQYFLDRSRITLRLFCFIGMECEIKGLTELSVS